MHNKVWYFTGDANPDATYSTKMQAEAAARAQFPDEHPNKRYARVYCKDKPSTLTFNDDELTLISNLIYDHLSSGKYDPGDPPFEYYTALQAKIDTDLSTRGVI